MKHRIIIPVLLLFLVSVSCSMFAGTVATPKPAEPVVEATVAQVEPQVVEPTAAPVEPTAAPEEPTAAPVEPTAASTEEPSGPQPFSETFDNGNPDGWKFFYIAGTEKGNKINVEDGVLRYQLNTKETYAYVENENQVYQDVVVTANVVNQGDNSNGMAVACRINPKGWYEFRISSGFSSIYLYRYDQAKKDKHQNPYVELVPQHVVKEVHPGFKNNKIALSCVGDTLRMFINDTELIYDNKAVTDDLYKEGYVGVGGMSFTTSNYAVKLDFEDVSAELPQ
jgi:hypothetical protein